MRLALVGIMGLLIFTLGGCATTVDCTQYGTVKDGKCPVHGCTMARKTLPADNLFLGYVPDYAVAIPKEFPYYDGRRHVHPGNYKYAIDYVCPDCTAAWRQWRATHHCMIKYDEDGR